MNSSNYLNEDFDGKKFQNFSEAKIFLYGWNNWLKIMFCLMSAVELVGVTIWWVHVKAREMRMRKLVLGLSLAQILPKKINKMICMLCPGRFSLVESVIHRLLSPFNYDERRRFANRRCWPHGPKQHCPRGLHCRFTNQDWDRSQKYWSNIILLLNHCPFRSNNW